MKKRFEIRKVKDRDDNLYEIYVETLESYKRRGGKIKKLPMEAMAKKFSVWMSRKRKKQLKKKAKRKRKHAK